jgi:hypothetical protein
MSVNKKIIETEAAVPKEKFNTVLYTGNGSTQSITGVGFQPDFVWIKVRSVAGYHHVLFDSTRGATKRIYPDLTAAENSSGQLSSFDSDGFSFSGGGSSNVSGQNMVAWCLKANGGTTSSNTDGSITSTVQANTNAGFSIIRFTGTGATATVGHGLNSTPEIYFMKNLDQSGYKWPTHTQDAGSLSGNYSGALNETAKFNSYPFTTANSTTIGLTSGQPDRNPSGQEMIVYAFHSVAGFSKIGTYTGIASGNVTVTTGFQPDYVMVKCASHATTNWEIHDTKRVYGATGAYRLRANNNSPDAGFNDSPIKFTSTGFYLDSSVTANSYVDYDANGRTYIYMAFKIN